MKGGDTHALSTSAPLRAASPSDAPPSAVRWQTAKDRVQNVRCYSPYLAPTRLAFPCGRCQACRINKRRIWTHRIMLESMQHAENSFVTLTYGVEPPGGSLQAKDLQDWLKRLRRHFEPWRIRHFSVGEYGDQSDRPHYHSAIFGLGCGLGPIKLTANGGKECGCLTCSAVRETWGFGHTMVGVLTEQSAQYIAGYTVKKMTQRQDPRLRGREPEFARMSLRPGIGACAVPDVASVMMQYKLEERGDVPVALNHGTKARPLGRYLRRELRRQVGLPDNAPPEVLEALREGLLPVWQYADLVVPGRGMDQVKKTIVQNALQDIFKQEAQNTAAKGLIYEKRKI